MWGIKADTSGIFGPVSIRNHEIQLNLYKHQVVVRKNGIEFLSDRYFHLWREVSLRLCIPNLGKEIEARGVVVDCVGNPHTGYVTTVMFLEVNGDHKDLLDSTSYLRI